MKLTTSIRRRVRREFFPEDFIAALRLLKDWNTKACAPGESEARMAGVVLRIAMGTLTWLRKGIAEAKLDFRDAIQWSGDRVACSVPFDRGEPAPEPIE